MPKELENITDAKREKIKKALFVGFPTFHCIDSKLNNMVQKIKRMNPWVVAGGWGVTRAPGFIFGGYRFPIGIKGVFGEALETAVELANYLKENPKTKEIPTHIRGLVYIDGEKVVHTGERKPKPLPPLHPQIPTKFFHDMVLDLRLERKVRVIPIFFRSCGCPHSIGEGCRFCDIADEIKRVGKGKIGAIRGFDRENAKKNMLLTLKKVVKLKGPIIFNLITDSARSIDLKNFLSLMEEMPLKFKKRIKEGGVSFMTRPDYINKEFLELVEKSGLPTIIIGIGVESYDQRDLDLVNKKVDVTQHFKIIEELQKRGADVRTFNIAKVSDYPDALDRNLQGILKSIQLGVFPKIGHAVEEVSVTGKPLTYMRYDLSLDLFYGLKFEQLDGFEEVLAKWKERGLDLASKGLRATEWMKNNSLISRKNISPTLMFMTRALLPSNKEKFLSKQFISSVQALGSAMVKFKDNQISETRLREEVGAFYDIVRNIIDKGEAKYKRNDRFIAQRIFGLMVYGPSFFDLAGTVRFLDSAVVNEKIAQILSEKEVSEEMFRSLPEDYQKGIRAIRKRVEHLGGLDSEVVRNIFVPDRLIVTKNIGEMKRYLTRMEKSD